MTSYLLLCGFVFFAAYFLNIYYITVFYHRGLTHGAIKLKPWTQKFVVLTGNWITGLDPKGWSCMHRMHHQYSDTPLDPHSPIHEGVYMLLYAQLRSYKRILRCLLKKMEPESSVVEDLDFPVNWLNRNKLWYLPYVVHLAIALGIGFGFHAWLLAGCYWFGIMSHPIQGWMVNAWGHYSGYRNFNTPDNSKNNILVALLVMGEGYQNNHHYRPQAAKFGVRWWELDLGYGLCQLGKILGLLEIPPQTVARPGHRWVVEETLA